MESNAAADTQLELSKVLCVAAKEVPNAEPSAPRIQEEVEGFESFLPGSLDDQTQSEESMGKKSVKKQLTDKWKPVIGKKKIKRWLPNISRRFQKKKNSSRKTVPAMDPTVTATDATSSLPSKSVGNTTIGMPPLHQNGRVPSTLPRLMLDRKTSAGVDSMKAVHSLCTDTPKAASEMIMGEEIHNRMIPDGNVHKSKPSSMSNGDKLIREGSDFARLLSQNDGQSKRKAIGKSHTNKQTNEDAIFDPATATEEELMKYYDLGQTLSEVLEARETLENAFGIANGGGSFDDTIDEQLVELLAQMAELDQDDAIEIEAAIKKLKKHARKLGISERDLLFSVKSTEEGTNVADNPGVRTKTSSTSRAAAVGFGDKVLNAFNSYFGSS